MDSAVANPATPTLTPEKILQVGLGFWASKTLLSAVELGLFSRLAQAPADRETLVRELGLNGRGAADFLDALVSLGFLERELGVYRNAPETDLFLDRAKPGYVGSLLEMANARLWPFWGHLTEALRTGQPQNESKTLGPDHFAALYEDPKRLEGFVKAMTGVSGGAARALAKAFDWSGVRTVLDAGCAEGAVPVVLAGEHPHLKALGFDLPPVRPHFEAFAAAHGVADRTAFVGGDIFRDPLPNADVVVLGHMLHWTDLEGKKAMLRRAHEALPEGGRVMVYDAVIDDDRRRNTFGLLMSLNMLIETPGGFDYTGADATAWMEEVGFREVAVKHLTGPVSAVVGRK